mmetsp:Transcript_37215/g.90404  ORF Transcript_37215/g.90404 Transcript_37215/m.90404 type:complete len:159 (-) Transcript_37215:304-780(-)
MAILAGFAFASKQNSARMAIQMSEEAYQAMMAEIQTFGLPAQPEMPMNVQQQHFQPQQQQQQIQYQPQQQMQQHSQMQQRMPLPQQQQQQQQMRMAPMQQQLQQPPFPQQRQRQMSDMVEIVYQDGGSEMVPRHVALQMGGRMLPQQQQPRDHMVAGY